MDPASAAISPETRAAFSRPTMGVWAMLGACLLATALVSLKVKQGNEEEAIKHFTFGCDQIVRNIHDRLEDRALLLRSGAALLAASPSVARQDWRRYVEKMSADESFTGVQGIGFALVIPPHQLAAHTARMRAEGFPDYSVHPAGERAITTAIIYLEPFREGNLRAFGYDMFSEPVQRAAMVRARDTGKLTLSGKVALERETGTDIQADSLLYVPVYRNGMAQETPAQRQAALSGWVYAPLRMNDLLGSALHDWQQHEGRSTELHIYEGSEASAASSLFDSHNGPMAYSLIHQQRTIEFYGRRWLLEFDHIGSASSVSYAATWATLGGGLALSGLIFFLMLLALRDRARAIRLTNAAHVASQHLEEIRNQDEALRKFSLVVEQSPESIAIANIDARIEYVNNAFVTTAGYSRDELLGQNPSILGSGKTPPESFRAMWAALSQGQSWKGELSNRRKDGSEYLEFAIITPLRQADGSISHYVAIKEDITEKKRAGLELDQYRHHLEALVSSRTAELLIERDSTAAASRIKDQFLANMSHEIRTPINAVMGFAHLCLKLDLPKRGRDYVSKIAVAAESLLGIINDILDMSKIEAGKLQMESVPFCLDDVLAQVATLFKLKANEKGVELVIAALPGIPDSLQGDPLRLGQVLTNLMSNALKFTERGEIRLTVEPVAVTAADVSLRFEVQDTGLGMTQVQQSRLFAAFSQADSSTTRKYGGTGLGLAISKQLVEAMHGEISVESEAGCGSCFRFSAHFAVAADLEAPLPEHNAISSRKVLVVDDNAAIRRLFALNINALGCQVETVDSGEAALARLESGADLDLIVMDWHLPGLDGLDTARRIRGSGSATPIVLITGDETELAYSMSEGAGINAFLPKPVSRSTLYDAMLTSLGEAAPLPTVVAQTQTLILSGARILLVDDNDFNRQIGRELLEITGATVDTADDGAQAVAMATPGGYDLVLMDLQMPVMDGYTAARILREIWPDLPILALTAHAMAEERHRVLAAGMSDILTKPIMPDALYALMARWLKSGDQQEAATTDLPPEPAPDHTPALAVKPELIFDYATALSRTNGNAQMLDRFLRLFRERNARIVAEIGTALATQEVATARRLAHSLNGGAGTVGLIELQATAARLEATLSEPLHGTDDPVRRSGDFAALESAWLRAMAALAAVLDSTANEQGANLMKELITTPSDATQAACILIVDDDPVVAGMLSVTLAATGHEITEANSGEEALAWLAGERLPDLIFLDIEMGNGINGFEVCRKLKASPAMRHIPVIFLTAKSESAYEQLGLALGAADYITKPISGPIVLARARTHLALKAAADFLHDKNSYLTQEVTRRTDEALRRTEELRISQEVTMVALASLCETRDNETGYHIMRTQQYVRVLAMHLRDVGCFSAVLNDEFIDRVIKAAPLHDIGKVGIPDRILLKPGRLDAEEFAIMKTHTTLGWEAIENAQRRIGVSVALLETAKEIALSHQEKWDGSGYPEGLAGEAIPLSARLMAVADVYDALVSNRVYKNAMTHEQAAEIMAAGRGMHFDPDITDAFVALQSEFRVIAKRLADQDDHLDILEVRKKLAAI